jgi:photosystem II stability/assembly factor-like uncharacterized protein
MSKFYKFDQASGRVLALAAAPAPGPLYVGAADGGVWSSTDAGVTWTPLTDDMPSLAIGALAVDPHDSNTVYAGTGEIACCALEWFYGVGIYASGNAGTSWTLYGNNLFQGTAVAAIRVDPTVGTGHGDNVYAATVRKQPGKNQGVAVSTNKGVTWAYPANVLRGKPVTDLEIDNAGNLYAAVSGPAGGCAAADGCGIYFSGDQGATWSPVSTGLPAAGGLVYKLALAPSTAGNPPSRQILYTVIGDAATGSVLGVYGTVNGGARWTQLGNRASLGDCGTQADYDIYLTVDPTNVNTVYVGLIDIFKTTNAGSSWQNLTKAYNFGAGCLWEPKSAAIHPDQHAALFRGATLYFGNDGGIYQTIDGGASFTSAIGNLGITQFYGGAMAADRSAILGGTQDNGTVQTTDAGWTESYGGDGFYTAIDSGDPTNWYTEYIYGKTYRSLDSGVTWNAATTGMPAPDGQGRIDPPVLFAAPLVMDPVDSRVLYSGHAHLWKTVIGMSQWDNVSPTVASSAISAIAIAPNDPNTIYIADAAGHAWRTTNAGASPPAWTSLDGPCPRPAANCLAPGTYITGLAVDPTIPQVLYAAVNGYQDGQQRHLFRSSDAGATWSDRSTSLPDQPFQTVAVNPLAPTVVYAGADMGVYVSTDSGTTWSRLGQDLPNAAVYQLVPSREGDQLLGFTHGRGAWQLTGVDQSGVIPDSWKSAGRLVSGSLGGHTGTLLTNGRVLVAGGGGAQLFNPVTGAWSATGPMVSPRKFHTATLLPDGSVLVAGGTVGDRLVATAERYNPGTGAWSATGSLSAPRWLHTATLLPDGTVLVAAGQGGPSGGPIATAEIHDPATGTWRPAPSLATPRSFHTATRLNDGTVLVAGGQDPARPALTWERYDPLTNSWSAGMMPRTRFDHAATLLADGTVLLAGGCCDGGGDLAIADRFDPSTGTWSPAGSIATRREGATATRLADGKVLLAGGSDNLGRPVAAGELYDPGADLWGPDGTMMAGRFAHIATLLSDGTVLVVAGCCGTAADTAERYHPSSVPPPGPA